MKNISADWQQHISQDITQICHCLILTHDAANVYLTDHDVDLNFLNECFKSDEYLQVDAVKFRANLVDDAFQLSTLIHDDRISYEMLDVGFLTAAKYSIYQVNWSDCSVYNLLKTGIVGDVEINAPRLTMTLHGIAKPLENRTGRMLQEKCDAQLGDKRCKVDVELPVYYSNGTIAVLKANNRLEVDLPVGINDGYFTGGFALVDDHQIGIIAHKKLSAVRHEVWFDRDLPQQIEIFDALKLTVGCDKSFETCRAKFNNVLEFRGFAHMPGKGFKFAYPQRSLIDE